MRQSIFAGDRLARVLVLVGLLGACTGTDARKSGDDLAQWLNAAPRRIVVGPPTFHAPQAPDVWVVETKRAATMAANAGGGALAGASLMSGGGCHGVGCGAVLLAIPLAVVGAVIGGMVGAVDPDTEEKAIDLGARGDRAEAARAVVHLDDRRIYEALRDGFIAELEARSPHSFALRDSAGPVDGTVAGAGRAEWRDLRVGFVADGPEDATFYLSVSGELAFELPGTGGNGAQTALAFAYRSGERSLAAWNAEGGKAVDGEVAKAAESLGHSLARGLLDRREEAPHP